MGTVLYVVCGIGNIKIGNLVRNMAPFLIVEMLVLFLLLFFFAVHRTHEVPHEVAPGNQVT